MTAHPHSTFPLNALLWLTEPPLSILNATILPLKMEAESISQACVTNYQ